MDFEQWLFNLGLQIKLSPEEVEKVVQFQEHLKSQGKKATLSQIAVSLKLITIEDMKKLHRHFEKLKKMSTLNTEPAQGGSSVNKITLFEELLQKDASTKKYTQSMKIPDQNLKETFSQETNSTPQEAIVRLSVGSSQPPEPIIIDEDLEATQLSIKAPIANPQSQKVQMEEVDFDDTLTLQKENAKNYQSNNGMPQKIGPYKVIRKLGQGNMGEVYLVRDHSLERDLALKLILASSRDTKSIQRFRREAKSIAQLRHSNIISVYQIGEEGEHVYFTMDYIKGQTLEDFIYTQKQKKLHFSKAVDIISKLAKALFYAHKKGLIHRDIKPANIMLDEKSEPYLMDFGLVQEIKSSKVSETQAFAGTPSYMSPEQARSKSDEIDEQSDIYSLGVTFYEMLTGRLPFETKELVTLLTQIVKTPPTPPSTYSRIPETIENICLKAMAKDKENRYSNAIAFAKDLDAFLASNKKSKKTVDVNFHKKKTPLDKYILILKTAAMFAFGMFFMFLFFPRGLEEKNQELEKNLASLRSDKKLLQDKVGSLKKKLQNEIINLIPTLKENPLRIAYKPESTFTSPVVNNGYLYVACKEKSGDVTLYAAKISENSSTQTDILEKAYQKNIKKTNIADPIIHNNKIYFVADNGIYVFHGLDFQKIYPSDLQSNKSLGVSHYPSFYDNQILFTNSSQGCIQAVDLGTNKMVWSYGENLRLFSPIATSSEIIAFASDKEIHILLSQKIKDKLSSKEWKIWGYHGTENIKVEPIIEKSKLYFVTGNTLYIADWKNKNIEKEYNLSKENDPSLKITSLKKYGNFVYITSSNRIYIVELSDSLEDQDYWFYGLPKEIKANPQVTSNQILHVPSGYRGDKGYIYTFFNFVPLYKYEIPYPVSKDWYIDTNSIYYISNSKIGSSIYKLEVK